MNTAKRTKRPETRRKPKMTNEQLLAFLSTSFHKTNLTVEHNMTVDFNQEERRELLEEIGGAFMELWFEDEWAEKLKSEDEEE